MTNTDPLTPSQDKRIMAALSHASVLLMMTGIIAPIVIWVTQKEKSRYVAFQSFQAIAYHLCMIAAWLLGMGCYVLSIFGIIMIPVAGSLGNSQNVDTIIGLGAFAPFLIFGFALIGVFAFVVYGIVGAVITFQGKPFRYALIGSRVEKYMAQRQAVDADQRNVSIS